MAVIAGAAVAFALPALARAETHLLGSGPLAVPLPAGSTAEKSLRPTAQGPVGTVAVWVRVAGARSGDLTLTLVAPDGRTRLLSRRAGGRAIGLGNADPFCGYGAAIFTDEAFEPLAEAETPFHGWVLPAQRLDTLKGVEAAGRWTLRIANAAGGTPGQLTCWRLELGLDIDTTRTASADGVTASVTYRELRSEFSRVRIHIAGPNGQLAVPFAQVKCSRCAASGPNLLGGGESPLTVRDLDGDGEPEVILDTYTGGAHCCSVSVIFRRVGVTYLHSVAWWGNPGYRLVDLDRDGRPELRTADDTFGYLFTSWASSGEPVLIFRYARGHLTAVTRDFPKAIQADADLYWRAAQEQLARRDGEPRGLLAAWAADMANLGKVREAFAQLDALAAAGKLGDNEGMGTTAGADYTKALRAHLRSQGYPVVTTNGTAATPAPIPAT